MLSRKIPLWILFGGMGLTFIAGWVNAIGFLGARHQAVSHLSGTTTLLGAELARPWELTSWLPAKVLVSFFAGSVLSGAIIRRKTLELGRRYGVALGLESAILFASTYYLKHYTDAGYCFAALACGLQNAMASSYSGSVIRTTHLTGMFTDFGIACGHFIARQPIEWRRFKLFGILIAGFILGSTSGAAAYSRFDYNAMLAPAVFSGMAALLWPIWQISQKPLTSR